MSKKYISVLCVFSIVINLFFGGTTLAQAAESSAVYIAPTNPELMQYLNQDNTEIDTVDGHMVTGYIPSPVELPSYKIPSYRQQFTILEASPFPTEYDARDYGYITAIKDQKISGPCWAFAATGVLESSLIESGESSADLSENHMIYSTDDYLTSLSSSVGPHSRGGNFYYSTAYYMRWGGPVLESSDPFPLQGPFDVERSASITNSYKPIKHVESIIQLPNLAATATETEKLAHRNKVKELIITYGSVGLGTYYDSNYQNADATAYYYNGTAPANHGVAIIGWDDNYSKDNFKSSLKPPGDGAWLIKNSWGDYNSLGGYYYVSYYDSHAEYDIMAIKSVGNADNYDSLYQYDPMGATTYSSRAGSNTCEFANVFDVNYAGEVLEAISFYNFSQNINYEVYINTDLSSSSEAVLNNASWTLAAQGTLGDAGYMTIPITPTLINGTKFAVSVRVTTTDGTDALIPIETSIPFTYNGLSSPSQSFRRFDATDTWVDITTLSDWAFSRANVCIKAYTCDSTESIPLNVLNTYPADNTIDVANNIVPSITFDQKIAPGTAYSEITIKTGNENVPYTPSVSGGTLTLTPKAPLQNGRYYTITLPENSIQNASGLSSTKNYYYVFFTAAAPKSFAKLLPTKTQSYIYNPQSIELDKSGNLYVAGTNSVQKYNSSEKLITQWGSPGSGNGQFNGITDIAVDASGNVYVLEGSYGRIQKFSSSGTYITQWGVSGNSVGIAIDRSNNIYVTNAKLNNIKKYNSSGTLITQWGSLGAGEGQFKYPHGIAIDSNNSIYVADRGNHRIQIFSNNGAYITQRGSYGLGDGQFSNLRHITIDSSNNLYAIDDGRIQKFDSSGTYLFQWGGYGTENGKFSAPIGIASYGNYVYVSDINKHSVQRFNNFGTYISKLSSSGIENGEFDSSIDVVLDSDDNIYVIEFMNHRIQKFDSSGNYIAQWGGFGTGDGQFYNPRAIAIDSNDNVYVVDGQNNRIQKFDSSGTYITQWGSKGTGNGQFSSLLSIAVDSRNFVYVLENSRIQKFDSLGSYIAKWGSSGTGDGQFASPYGIAIDDSDKIYVVESANHRIQTFDTLGNCITKWDIGDGSRGVTVDRMGYVYVSYDAGIIKKFNSSGKYICQWSSDSGNGQFLKPWGIEVDSNNNVYVADYGYNRIMFMDINPSPLNVINSNPANNAINVSTSIIPSITFDQNILAWTAYNNITLKMGDENVSFTPSISGSTLTLTPSAALEKETTYTVTIPFNSVQNENNCTLSNNYILSFSTAILTLNYGDVNGDGLINISDVIITAEIAVGKDNTVPVAGTQNFKVWADVNGDLIIDISDVVLIIERISGGTAPFPVEP